VEQGGAISSALHSHGLDGPGATSALTFPCMSYINSGLSLVFFLHLLQELAEWNARYREKFGFVFMICASGRTAAEVLAELKV
jgi:hypothetical protein